MQQQIASFIFATEAAARMFIRGLHELRLPETTEIGEATKSGGFRATDEFFTVRVAVQAKPTMRLIDALERGMLLGAELAKAKS